MLVQIVASYGCKLMCYSVRNVTRIVSIAYRGSMGNYYGFTLNSGHIVTCDCERFL